MGVRENTPSAPAATLRRRRLLDMGSFLKGGSASKVPNGAGPVSTPLLSGWWSGAVRLRPLLVGSVSLLNGRNWARNCLVSPPAFLRPLPTKLGPSPIGL